MTEETARILEILEETYPDAHCELDHETPLELLVATVLSAQTTDRQVNIVTKKLFADCPTLDDYLRLSEEELRGYIRSLGFFNTKAAHLYLLFRELSDRFGGEVPRTMEELTSLPGVGRKTANVVLSNAFGVPALAVDTHVFRVANRIGLCAAKTPEETETALQAAIDRSLWSRSHHLLIFHGRRICDARRPLCESCPIRGYCRHYAEKQGE